MIPPSPGFLHRPQIRKDPNFTRIASFRELKYRHATDPSTLSTYLELSASVVAAAVHRNRLAAEIDRTGRILVAAAAGHSLVEVAGHSPVEVAGHSPVEVAGHSLVEAADHDLAVDAASHNLVVVADRNLVGQVVHNRVGEAVARNPVEVVGHGPVADAGQNLQELRNVLVAARQQPPREVVNVARPEYHKTSQLHQQVTLRAKDYQLYRY